MSGEIIRIALSSFVLVFLAELGDKTQLAVFGLACESSSPWAVLLGAGIALLLSTPIAVILGSLFTRLLPPHLLHLVHYVAGGLFIIAGIWVIWKA